MRDFEQAAINATLEHAKQRAEAAEKQSLFQMDLGIEYKERAEAAEAKLDEIRELVKTEAIFADRILAILDREDGVRE